MHIAEGILSGEILIGSSVVAGLATAIGLRKLDYDKIPQAGVLSASFFVASLIHVPLAFTSAHLVLNGVIGVIMGWAAFPVILVALLLQVVFFQYGGFTTLGANTLIMALPAVICYGLFRGFMGQLSKRSLVAGFLGGALSVAFSAVLLSSFLFLTGEGFWGVASLALAAHLPVMLIEGIITAFCIQFLLKVHPVMLIGNPVGQDLKQN